MTKKKTQSESKDYKLSVDTSTHVDLFETICSTSSSKEACRRFVDRLEETKGNIRSKSSKKN